MNRKRSLMVAAAALLGTGPTTAMPGVTLRAAHAEDRAQAAAVRGVAADEFFHVEWAASAGSHGRARLTGYVYNDWGEFAKTVELRITGLDTSGNVVSSIVQPVADVPPGARVYFEAQVPGRSRLYRVVVESYDFEARGKE